MLRTRLRRCFWGQLRNLSVHLLGAPTEKPISYRELFEQDGTYYQITARTPLKYQMAVDLQFLAGVSCGVSTANALLRNSLATTPDRFGNITIETCNGHDDTDYTVKVVTLNPIASETVVTDEKVVQRCFRCTVGISNLPAVACGAPLVGQALGFGVGVFQGALRLIANLQDPDNIPHGSELNVDQISATFDSSKGKVSKRCHNRLLKGLSCSSLWPPTWPPGVPW